MATYYVRTTGSDAAAGTSAGTAWLTLAKLLGAAGMASGDTAYVGAGTYREVVSVAMTSPTAETSIIGDVDGAMTGDAGDIIWTAYINESASISADVASTSSSPCLNLSGRDFLTFDLINFIGGSNSNGSCIQATASHSTNITLRRCTFQGSTAVRLIAYTNIANVAANWMIDRCVLFYQGAQLNALLITVVDPNSATDLDLNFIIQNCLICSGLACVQVAGPASAAQAGKPGGVSIRNCTLFAGGNCFFVQGAAMSTATPCSVYNSILMGSGGLNAAASGQIVEDFNKLMNTTARTNVSAGANTIGNSASTIVELGQAAFTGRAPRPFLSLCAGSPILGFGNTTAFTAPTEDLTGRPRPSGCAFATQTANDTGTAFVGSANSMTDTSKSWTTNQWRRFRLKITGGLGAGQYRYIISNSSTVLTLDNNLTTSLDGTSTYQIYNSSAENSIGAHERHDFAVKETTTFDSTPAIRMRGPGDHDLLIPVPASACVITIKVQRDGNYGAGTKPRIILLANGEIGVATETITDAGSASTWNTLTLSSFTPTAAGVVKVRLDASGSANIGNTYWDTATVPVLSSGTEGLSYFLRGEPFPALTHDATGGAAGVSGSRIFTGY